MTREEWKARAAARYVEKLGVNAGKAATMAQALFDGQDGVFSESVNYDPEGLVDDDVLEYDPEIEGAEAYYQGRGQDANPYGGDAGEKWIAGWEDAQSEERLA